MAMLMIFCKRACRVLFIIINLLITISLLTPILSTAAHPLEIPLPLYPENYANTTPLSDPPLGIPSFSWLPVSGTNKYRLQVDNESGFNAPLALNITTSNTNYTPARTDNLFSDGEWYWRVRIEEPAPVGEWSEIMIFTKSWAMINNAPALLSPPDNEQLAFFNYPDFSWTPVMGSAKYMFQVASSPDGFTTPIFSTDTLTTSFQPSRQLDNGEYWWRVIPMDTAGHWGTSSEIRKFTLFYGTYPSELVPTLIEPLDESSPVFTPNFRWTAVEGAEYYHLEYTSNPSCDYTHSTSIETRGTTYTPMDTFPNHVRYCWHVRAQTVSVIGDWSNSWHFSKQWQLQPRLLTPTNNYPFTLYPLYSWTPVPGASHYYIEIADNPNFNPIFESSLTANTTYAPQTKYYGTLHYYWRVTPIDGGDNPGITSEVSEFWSHYDSTAPILVYPLYYYPPNDPDDYGNSSMNPYEDRTVAYPVFMWHRVMNPTPDGGIFGNAYRIQVDITPQFDSIIWEYDTENTSATPTSSDDFTPVFGQDYYWRVCVLNYIGGDCIIDQRSGWSQVWKARFDPGKAITPTSGDQPELLRPAIGQEIVEASPLLEWQPFQEVFQATYQVEISRDSSFSTFEVSQTVNIPAFSPAISLAQRSLGKIDYGTFYWRVRAFGEAAWSEWSDIWRFQIASQSEWRYARILGDTENQLIIADDPPGDAPLTYDLTTLFASQSSAYWFLGFNAYITSTNTTYVFYLDLDHIDGSGAESPPARSYNVTTISAHQPEYAIYIDKINGKIDSNNTWVYAWEGFSWNSGNKLSDIGGSIYTADNYVELKLPDDEIGMMSSTSSASLTLFSVDGDTGEMVDSVPSDPEVPGNTQISRFTAVSDHINLLYPPSIGSGNLNTIFSLLPFYWDWPTGGDPSTPYSGSKLEVHLDPGYTSLVAEFQLDFPDSYFGENHATFSDDLLGDRLYYWRVQPRYWLSGHTASFGAWSGGWSFQRQGFKAQNLQISLTSATPTFSWDMAEGAKAYHLQVSSDPDFDYRFIDQITQMTSYTPQSTLAEGAYYWRIGIIRYGDINNDWSNVEEFSITLPMPEGLHPDNDLVHYAPTFCWDPILLPQPEPNISAWKYRVQISRDVNFKNIYDTVDTHNHCWTPTTGYVDGFYWWRVAMIDGNNRLGSYSSAASFVKQYPRTSLISPIHGNISQTPTFIWNPVDQAANYRLEVSLFSTFHPLIDAVTTINTQFTPEKPYDTNKEYYWRVAIVDQSGNQGPFIFASIIIGKGKHLFLPISRR